MLERYLTETLTKHFGHFVENLDRDQVRLSAWKGEIHLQNLQIRKHALDSVAGWKKNPTTTAKKKKAPVEIAYGRVGNLQVSIPWTVLRNQLTTWRSHRQRNKAAAVDTSSQVSIVLTDVYLLITPRRYETTTPSVEESEDDNKNDADDDEEETTQENIELREEEIQEALNAELLKRVAESSADTRKGEEKKSWIQDRLTSLLENLSVTVRNIHIRYEDTGHSMGFQWTTDVSRAFSGMPFPGMNFHQGLSSPIHRYRPAFCVGITLQEFSIHASDPIPSGEASTQPDSNTTTNANEEQDTTWQRKIRVASAEALAIYWDSDTPIISEVAVQRMTEGPEFYEEAFAMLQSGNRTRGWSPKGGFAPEHSFVLDPFSPSITLSLVQQKSMEEKSEEVPAAPPSTLKGHLPPCRFALSRNLLEDLGYLRKSYAAWRQSVAGHISDATLRRLAGLRPAVSPCSDPKGWWRYAIEAMIAVNQAESDNGDRGSSQGTRAGWLGVARLLALRKKYLKAYQELIQAQTIDDRLSSHDKLVSLEDKLHLPEVVAFRIHTYSWLRDAGIVEDCSSDDTKSKSLDRWNVSGPKRRSAGPQSQETRVTGADSPGTSDTDERERGCFDRLHSFFEMGQALDREKMNVQTKELEDNEEQDLAYGLGNELNPMTWKADLSCGEVSLQVNDKRVAHRHRDKPAPVVRLSCAFTQIQHIYRDGSWQYDLAVGSLKVKDCTHYRSRTGVVRNFSYLIGPKRGYNFKADERFAIDDKEYDQIIRFEVSRSQHAFRSTALGSTTS